MDNELIREQSWWKRNWKWFLPTFIIMLLLGFGLLLSSSVDGNVTDIAQAYADNSLYEKAIEKAIEKAKTNKRVLEVMGEIEPIDKLAILEGNAIYSNNHNSVELSVRVKGNKGKGKMDISAKKNGNEWEFKKINIRIKEPKEEIQIL
ncbi:MULTISPECIES: cytochrome c oxidase assembly factor Coa1 family protein [unclassified Flavobacterium]|uniref:cytochrome c oxidase assembly factor Coa1 family protein n=1 Tax=unclassified Flavobacterium TaxID=196869 RepID=UPI00131C8B7A|nr:MULTISPECIES: cytochrome c oxidase assembly factor Coa1 family protein [unclassified Flavobacterium]